MLVDTLKFLDSAEVVKSDGSTKYVGAALYDIAASTLSKPTDDAVLMRFSVARSFKLPAGLTGSKAESLVAPTGAVSYSIKKNGSSVGTIDFASATNDATFTFSSEETFAIGDILTIQAPATADSTHDEIAFTLAATLVV